MFKLLTVEALSAYCCTMRTHWNRQATIVVVILTLGLTITGCTDAGKSQDPESATPTVSVTDPPTTPAARQSAYDDAAKTVTTVMTEYFDTKRSSDEWFAALEPHLSLEAQYLYEDANIKNIPDGNVTGTPRLVSDDAKGLRYFVDTSIGQFTVILVLEGDTGGTYVVDEIQSPGSGKYD